MRIMMLPQFYPPVIGGEERLAQDLSEGLARRGHDVSVVTLWQPGLKEGLEDGPVRVHRVRGLTQALPWLYEDATVRLATPYPDPGVLRRLRAIIDAERPEVLHGHNWMVYSAFPLKRRSGARLVWTLGDHSLVCAKKKLVWFRGGNCAGPRLGRCIRCASDHYGWAKGVPTTLGNMAMGAAARRMVDRFLPVSDSVARRCGLSESGAPFEVIPNFIRSGRSAGETGTSFSNELPEADFILYVGALGSHKGVDVLLEAYRRIIDAPPLVVIGYETNEYPVKLSGLPEGVSLLTNVRHESVMEAWRRAAVGVVPSTWDEPFGIVAIEAMVTGTPVVASRIGGLTDIVEDGRTGFLVEPGDPAALAGAISTLAGAPDLRRRMGQEALRRSQRFEEDSVVPRFERMYAEVVEGGRRPSRLSE